MIAEIKQALLAITGVAENDKKDVMVLAAANTAELDAEFTALEKEITENTKETVFKELESLLNAWGLTANMGWRKVSWIAEHQRIPTAYDIAYTTAANVPCSYEDALKKVCNQHYSLRIEFNKAVKNEELFKYVAFNLGSLGLQSFGEFCFFVDNATASAFDNLVFLKGNSLDCYALVDDQLDMEKLERDISLKELVAKLVAIKHREDIIQGDAGSDWAGKVCNGKGYVEGLLIDDLTLANINCVKIDSRIDNDFVIAALSLSYGEAIRSEEADMINNYMTAKNTLKDLGLTINII